MFVGLVDGGGGGGGGGVGGGVGGGGWGGGGSHIPKIRKHKTFHHFILCTIVDAVLILLPTQQ